MSNSPVIGRHRTEHDARSSTSTSSPADESASAARPLQVRSESSTSTDGQVVVVASGAGSILHVLQPPAALGDTGAEALVGSSIDELWEAEPLGQLARHAKRSIRTRQVEGLEMALASGEGHLEFTFVPNGPDRVIVIGRDVSERKLSVSRLEKLAYFDTTTELPNRQLLLDELARCTDTLRLTEGRAAVLCFDISTTSFKHTANSSHQLDLVFVELANRLTHSLRGANNMSITDLERYSIAARTNYSQFGVLLPDIDCGESAEGVAERLVETLCEPIDILGRKVRAGVHAGVALFPQDGRDADTLYANAVAAMEDAVTSKAACKLHSGTLRLRALQRQDIEAQLSTALEHGAFAVEFLPVVDAASRRVVSAEALLRWPQNVFNAMSISEVVTVAENTGLIGPIGDWVLRQSCDALKSWQAAGWSDLRLSVNLSAQELSREDKPRRIAAILQEYGIDAAKVDVEINEYTLFRDAIKDYASCNALKEVGVGIVVDDYGTGACSLIHLSRSPVEAIKVDRSLVTNLGDEPGDRDACAAVVALATKLGMRTIAEGVETEQQAEFLLEQGCNYLQGFLTCKPATAERMLHVLAETNRT